MTICNFIETICDSENIIFTLFDCNTSKLVEVSTDDGKKYDLNIDELSWSTYADYEIMGMDIWIDKGKIRIEFNIDIDEEDE